jgi:hypothetical protein
MTNTYGTRSLEITYVPVAFQCPLLHVLFFCLRTENFLAWSLFSLSLSLCGLVPFLVVWDLPPLVIRTNKKRIQIQIQDSFLQCL